MYSRIIAAIATVLLTVNCSAQATKPAPDPKQSGEDYEPPLQIAGDKVSEAELMASIKRARRVLVVFESFKDTQGNEFICPVKVRTVDSVCDDPHYMNTDPSVICRVARKSGPGQNVGMEKIIWRQQTPEGFDPGEFTIVFPSGIGACDNWDGSKTARKTQVCDLGDARVFGVPANESAYIKYDVIGSEGEVRCGKLDPHFIVRN